MARLWCLDTNILISGLVFRGPEHHLLQWLQSHHEPILWFPTLEHELIDVLSRKFPAILIDWPDVFPSGTRIVVKEPPLPQIRSALDVLRDPKDGPILAAARFYLADYLVTGDKDLLVLSETEDTIQIITTREASLLMRFQSN